MSLFVFFSSARTAPTLRGATTWRWWVLAKSLLAVKLEAWRGFDKSYCAANKVFWVAKRKTDENYSMALECFILIPLKMAQVKEPFYARFRRNIHQKGMLFLISIKKVGPHWWHNLPKWGFLGGFYRHKDGLRHCFTNKCRCHLSVQWPIWAASCSWYVFDAYNTTSHNMLVLLNELTTKAYTDTYIYTYIFQY